MGARAAIQPKKNNGIGKLKNGLTNKGYLLFFLYCIF